MHWLGKDIPFIRLHSGNGYHHDISDKSVHTGGKRRIKTVDGYMITLSIHNGLPRLKMHPPSGPSGAEFNALPHVIMTPDQDWDPSLLDFDYDDAEDEWFDTLEEHEENPYHSLFDE
jgi:hypothetical protein